MLVARSITAPPAIVVSNHGGRQLDGTMPTSEALAEVADAVGDRVEILVDGGIRRGSDILKALALGARAVLIGRPYLWALGRGRASRRRTHACECFATSWISTWRSPADRRSPASTTRSFGNRSNSSTIRFRRRPMLPYEPDSPGGSLGDWQTANLTTPNGLLHLVLGPIKLEAHRRCLPHQLSYRSISKGCLYHEPAIPTTRRQFLHTSAAAAAAGLTRSLLVHRRASVGGRQPEQERPAVGRLHRHRRPLERTVQGRPAARRHRGRVRRRSQTRRKRQGKGRRQGRHLRRLSQAARSQGYRRRDDRHARSLAHQDRDRRHEGRQGRLLRKAAHADDRRRQADLQGGSRKPAACFKSARSSAAK